MLAQYFQILRTYSRVLDREFRDRSTLAREYSRRADFSDRHLITLADYRRIKSGTTRTSSDERRHYVETDTTVRFASRLRGSAQVPCYRSRRPRFLRT